MTPDQREEISERDSYDRYWIAENLHWFAPLAREGFAMSGRGAILVNLAELILRRNYEEGHPFNYHPTVERWLETDDFEDGTVEAFTRQKIRQGLEEYDPAQEFLLVLVRSPVPTFHRLKFPNPEEEDLEIRGRYLDAEEEHRFNRLCCSDFWARSFRLTSPHTGEWLYRVA
jgi:hypothetical protein